MADSKSTNIRRRHVRVWDLPVRVFHWLIVGLLVVSFVTGHVGGNAMRIHELSGFSILTLVLFRLSWGFLGSTHARFSSFVRGFAAARSYTAVLWSGSSAVYTGHNPLGGWMVVALLALAAAAGLSGWLSITDRFWGVEWLQELHEALANMLYLFVGLHLAGVFFTSWRHRENLVAAMMTGCKRAPGPGDVD